MTQTFLSEIQAELRRKIKFWHEMANHEGSGRSGTMKSRIRAQVLSDFLGWINKLEQGKLANVPDTDGAPLGV